MVKKLMGAVALAAAMVGGAQAAPVTILAGQSVVFNFGNLAAPLNSTTVRFGSFALGQGVTGTATFYSGLDLAGSVIYVDNDLNNASNDRTDLELLNPFSVLVSIGSSSPSFSIDPSADYWNATGAPLGRQEGTIGDTSGLTPVTPPTAGNVPEPGSLALVSLAGLGLIATRRRRA